MYRRAQRKLRAIEEQLAKRGRGNILSPITSPASPMQQQPFLPSPFIPAQQQMHDSFSSRRPGGGVAHAGLFGAMSPAASDELDVLHVSDSSDDEP